MLLNRHKLNTNKLNVETSDYVSYFVGGVVVRFRQNVGASFTGLVATFKQTVNLRATYTPNGAVVTFNQGVQHTMPTGTVITIRQYVE